MAWAAIRYTTNQLPNPPPATMPLHRIYTTVGLYTTAEKHSMSKAITSLYDQTLPVFYVVVAFVDLPADSFFIGGEPNPKFARINVQHIARHFKDKSNKLGFMQLYENAIKPFTAEKGIDWEVALLPCLNAGLRLNVTIIAGHRRSGSIDVA